jgi:hypothetical protein
MIQNHQKFVESKVKNENNFKSKLQTAKAPEKFTAAT